MKNKTIQTVLLLLTAIGVSACYGNKKASTADSTQHEYKKRNTSLTKTIATNSGSISDISQSLTPGEENTPSEVEISSQNHTPRSSNTLKQKPTPEDDSLPFIDVMQSFIDAVREDKDEPITIYAKFLLVIYHLWHNDNEAVLKPKDSLTEGAEKERQLEGAEHFRQIVMKAFYTQDCFSRP